MDLNYKRLDHFHEILNQITGNHPNPPDRITNEVVHYLNANNLDYSCDNVKSSLRQLNLVKYYEYTQKLYLKLNNLPNIQLDTDVKNQLDSRFLQLSMHYQEIASPRRSFLSYYFILRKLLQFIEKESDDVVRLIDSIPVISNVEKHQINNEVWEKICDYFDWEFVAD